MITVVIPAYNSEKTIQKTLDTLKHPKIKEIIVVDDGSTDKTVEIAEKHATIIKTTHGGAAKARNIGIKKCKTEKILLIDSDVYIDTETIDHLDKQIKNNLITYPQTLFETGGIIHPVKKQEYNYPHITTCLLTTKTLYNQIGLFDENFKLYGEDTDFFHRCATHKIPTKYVPNAKAYHLDRIYPNHNIHRYYLESQGVTYGALKWMKKKKAEKHLYYNCLTFRYLIIIFVMGVLNLNPYSWEIYMKRGNTKKFFKYIITKSGGYTQKRDLKSLKTLMKLFIKGVKDGIHPHLQ